MEMGTGLRFGLRCVPVPLLMLMLRMGMRRLEAGGWDLGWNVLEQGGVVWSGVEWCGMDYGGTGWGGMRLRGVQLRFCFGFSGV